MFAIDRSGSMAFTLGGVRQMPREQWRWSILRELACADDHHLRQPDRDGAKLFPEVIRRQPVPRSRPGPAGWRAPFRCAAARGNAQNILRSSIRRSPSAAIDSGGDPRLGRGAPRAAASRSKPSSRHRRRPTATARSDKSVCTHNERARPGLCHITAGGEYNCLSIRDRTVETIHTNEDLEFPFTSSELAAMDRPDPPLDVPTTWPSPVMVATGARRYYAAVPRTS